MNYFQLFTIFLFGLMWMGIVAFLRNKKKKRLRYLMLFSIFYFYIYKVLDYTLFQYQSLLLLKLFKPDLMLNGLTGDESINFFPLIKLTEEDLKTSILNILLFVPFGLGLPMLIPIKMQKIIIWGMLFSIGIELIQLMTGIFARITFRIADINDVIFNTTGVICGYCLFIVLKRTLHKLFQKRNL